MFGLLINPCTTALHHQSYHWFDEVQVNKEIGEGKLKDFNLGHLMKLPLAGLKCICGKPLGHSKDDAICAACGLVILFLYRLPALPHAIKTGKIKAIAPIIWTIMRSQRKSIWEVSSSKTFSISETLTYHNGII